MNDLEDQLRALELSQPDPAWRREILAQCQLPATTSWRDWFWPSPLAWATLAVIWLGCGIAYQVGKPVSDPSHPALAMNGSTPLFALQSQEDMEALFPMVKHPRHL